MWDPRVASCFEGRRFRSLALTVVTALCVWSSSLNSSLAGAGNNGIKGAEEWASAQIKKGEIADFNRRCVAIPFDTACRVITAAFLSRVLKRGEGQPNRQPSAGVRIIGTTIVGDIWLDNADLFTTNISESRIDGRLSLRGAHIEGVFRLDNAQLVGGLDASGLRAENSIFITNSIIEKDVNFDDCATGCLEIPSLRAHASWYSHLI
jgi:hypothetical protein